MGEVQEVVRRFFFILPLVFLAACAESMTMPLKILPFEQEMLNEIHTYAKKQSETERLADPIADLFKTDPITAARIDAQNGDYSLISMAEGYEATANDARIFGVKCWHSPKIKKVVFGCAGASFLLKPIAMYNIAMIQQPGFPYKELCKIDSTHLEYVHYWSAELEKALMNDKNFKK